MGKATPPALPVTPEAPALPAEPVLPPSLETPAAPEVTGEGPFKVRHKVNGGEFEVSAEYLAMYREMLELL